MSDDLAILPHGLWKHSLSDQELVLPLEAALQAVELLRAERISILGWEGWLVFPDGRTGHSAQFQGTETVTSEPDETWLEYIERSANLCVETMKKDHESFTRQPEVDGAQLFFCITIGHKSDG